jgi:predicted unusual protein kinase regulating ubiquinone biosynthesis (AarF/ABC1/UbiB family)
MFFPSEERGLVFGETSAQLLEECDYHHEKMNQQAFAELFRHRDDIVIPKVIEALSGSRILTTTFAEGETLASFRRTASQDARNRAMAAIFDFYFMPWFDHCLCHFDPHPDNVLFRDNQVVFLDFGRVRRFSRSFVDGWKSMLRALCERNREAFRQALIGTGFAPRPERFDFDFAFGLMALLYRTWLTVAEPFTVEEYRSWGQVLARNVNAREANTPKDAVLLEYLGFGIGAWAIRLGATFDVRSHALPLLYGPTGPYPEPYSASEYEALIAHLKRA